MPNGEANITNNILEMMHADRHTVGQYKCTADNRVGTPDQRDIFVNVLCESNEQCRFWTIYMVYTPHVHMGKRAEYEKCANVHVCVYACGL